MLRPADESIRQRLARPARRVGAFFRTSNREYATPLATQTLTRIPDWCNAGIAVRVLVGWNLIAMAVAACISGDPIAWANICLRFALTLEPTLIASLLLGCLTRPLLGRLPLALQIVSVMLIPAVLVCALEIALGPLLQGNLDMLLRDACVAGGAAGATLYWARLRSQSYLPALAEARLAALQARIRPHFLFNSLTAVLGLIRSDARRAETMLEDLADLFRVLMRDHHQRVPLSEEIDLCRKYLEIESLRLGARLRIEIDVDPRSEDALVPLLLLQPLVENAVLHGVEPAAVPGLVQLKVEQRGQYIHIMVTNPWHGEDVRRGHQVGLSNVRQRLELLHDLEARLETRVENGRFILEMTLPQQHATMPASP
jgi:two-component system sensor histidine kinase AlgZ